MAQASSRDPLAPPGGLSVVEWFLVAQAAKTGTKDWRDHLTPGEHDVDVMLRLVGTLKVGEEQTAIVKQKPALDLLLTIMFDELGPKGKLSMMAAMLKRLPEINTAENPEEKLPLEARRLAKEVIDLLTTASEQKRAGNVTAAQIEVTKLPGVKPYKGK